jgi:hypothetical protein
MTALERIWNRIRQSEAQLPTKIAIPRNQVDRGEKLGGPFERDEHYFQVEVNEMFLTYNREWFSSYDPLVLIISEFSYAKERRSVPFVVGPNLIKADSGKKVPNGMLFTNTRVAGIHPYRGDGLTISVMLYRMRVEDHLRKLMKVVETAAGALSFGTALGAYLKVADVIFDGVDSLFDMGKIDPVVGHRQEFKQGFEPGYFALIDMPEQQARNYEFWVREQQLVVGDALATAEPFRDADYVLYSISQMDDRDDLDLLPVYPLWECVAQEAAVANDTYWKNAKASMAAFHKAMVGSPDLTSLQTDRLLDEYITKMKNLHNSATKISMLSDAKRAELSEMDEARLTAVSILDM